TPARKARASVPAMERPGAVLARLSGVRLPVAARATRALLRSAIFAPMLALTGCGAASTTESGTLHLAVQSDPAMPALGRNTFVVEVTSPDGAPLDGMSVTLTPWMPAHGHGSTEQPTITPLGNGRYQAFPVTLFMVGDWQVTARAAHDGEFGTWM